ncbi:baeRF10 domain-containing protein [Anaeromyxobacter oryzae]|uniref:eRF1 domain-containing protein n=1 Tax=Anaeromyxobacter oryzae TaxID=2918170 RepID=A0ABN6MUM1_9BACT|nr:hypothetical protein [Anaeromyxobacter oryzae]BDG03453.1 hypothetical protein AMOR_24490 [Anaeromyxobacter oryzae]
MTQLDGTLSELAKLRSGSEPIVSLYLDTRWSDEHQRERVRLFVQEKIRKTLGHYADGTPGKEGLERTLRKIQDFVSGLTGQVYEKEKSGLALFACESSGLWRTLFFARPFRPELCTDGFPHLTQLARLADDFEPAIVVAPSQAGADIFHVSLGDLALESHLRGFVPRQEEDQFNSGSGRPGQHYYERQSKDERHQEAFVQKNRKAAVQEVQAVFDHNPGCHLVLVGPSETVAAFERELPERLREQVIARIPRPRQWDNGDGVRADGVVAGAAEAVADHEKQKEQQVIDAVVGQSLRGGLAVMGPDDVVEALNQGRVHKLVLEEDFTLTGWRCDNCDAIGANAETQEVCPYCRGDLKVLQHLGEAMVTRALAEGAEVEIVAHANKLHSYRSVGAFLRQTAQTGLRGASQPWPSAPGASQS